MKNSKEYLRYKKFMYALHVGVTVPVLCIHYMFIPFKFLYDITDWSIVNYQDFRPIERKKKNNS